MYLCSSGTLLKPASNFKSSQEDVIKKRVSFDIPTMSQCEVTEVIENEITSNNKGDQITGIVANQFDLSIGDDKFSSIKDMILKKHNLDLSPQFVYGKNMAMLQKVKNCINTLCPLMREILYYYILLIIINYGL